MVSRKKAEQNFRDITFVGTENKLGRAPRSFKSKKNKGLESFANITFMGTERRLGSAPKGFDGRKKARNRLKEFEFGDELI